MKTSWYLTIVSAAAVFLWVAVAGAEWSHDPSENNPVCEASGDQQSVQIVEDGVGGHIVSWEDSQTGDLNIYAQLVDAWGDVVWISGGIVVTDAANDQHIAKMVGDGTGGAIVVWQDYRNGTDYQVYAQRLDSSGAPMWGGGVAVCAETGDQDGAVLVGDGSGGAIIAWADHRGAYGGAIYAQRVDASGTLLWPGGIAVAPDTTGARGSIAIAADGSGGAVLAWADDRASDGGIYAARVDASGNEVWTSGGNIVVGAGTSWDSPAILGDGAGGATIAFEETIVAGEVNILAQRVDGVGQLLLGPGGVTVSAAAGEQLHPALVTDGAGGVIISWLDDATSSIYAQRLNASGLVSWLVTGVPVSFGMANVSAPKLVSDCAGGAVIGWHGGLAGQEGVYAQRVDASGMTLWTLYGEVVSNAPGYQKEPAMASDGAGGAVVAWTDSRSGAGTDIYAQRIERNGFLGYPAPVLTSCTDHPDDQGGQVILSWAPSYLDIWPNSVVDGYTVWRRYAETSRASCVAEPPWLTYPEGGEALERHGWAYVGQVQAWQVPEYAYVVPTFGDSTEAGILWTDVMVLAYSYLEGDTWMSGTMSGYSVDNWAPGPPDSLKAVAVGPDAALTWSPSRYRDEDLSHYDIHRSDVPGFTPGASTLIASPADTVFTDVEPGEGTWYYRVVAEDVHSNESDPSGEAWVALETGVDDSELSTVLTIRGNTPNPFNPMTSIAYDLPENGHMRLDVFSAAGDLVVTIEDGFREAGRHEAAWRGVDAAGRALPSGVYFARLEAGKERAVHKMVLLK